MCAHLVKGGFTMPDAKTVTPTPATSWRDLYPVHPCADVFPMMSDAELEALAQDIKAHGLQQPVVLWRDPTVPRSGDVLRPRRTQSPGSTDASRRRDSIAR